MHDCAILLHHPVQPALPCAGVHSFAARLIRALDILFFDARKRLINISADTPPCKTTDCPTYSSDAPAMYVLELNAGTALKSGLKRGDILALQH